VEIPADLSPENVTTEEKYYAQKDNTRIIAGSSLILLGLFILLKNTGIWYFNFFGIGREIFIPVALILAGIYLVIKFGSAAAMRSPDDSVSEAAGDEVKPGTKKLYRSTMDRKLAGVCGGLGEYLNIDSNLIRIFWLIFTFCSFGIGILIYIIFVIFVPEYSSGNINE
jgi:phage shock protein PspC (stress-responsive transcriptional regulator)